MDARAADQYQQHLGCQQAAQQDRQKRNPTFRYDECAETEGRGAIVEKVEYSDQRHERQHQQRLAKNRSVAHAAHGRGKDREKRIEQDFRQPGERHRQHRRQEDRCRQQFGPGVRTVQRAFLAGGSFERFEGQEGGLEPVFHVCLRPARWSCEPPQAASRMMPQPIRPASEVS